MWEAIAANKRRSRLLLICLMLLLVALGALIGANVDPQMGAAVGGAVAVVVWGVLALTALYAGDSILLATAGAHKLQREDAPQLFNIVEEMTLAAGLATPPAVYVIEDDGLNAFAVGRKPEVAAVAVTSGMLKRLNRDELQGVIGHEIGHVRNLDIRFMTMAAVLVGSIVIMSDIFLRGARLGTVRRTSKKGDNNVEMVLFLITLLVAILAPILAQILYFACSRKREYLADASSARYTRYPPGLASALQKIGDRAGLQQVSRASAPLFIINPLNAVGGEGLFSTHPPLGTRIEILNRMAGAGYAEYEAAYEGVKHETGVLGKRTLEGDAGGAAIRAADTMGPALDEAGIGEAVQRADQIGHVTDLLARIGNYLVIPCTCGMKIKLPPEFQGNSIVCPRCNTEHMVPQAQLALARESLEATSGETIKSEETPPPMEYVRSGQGWESFRCACGQTQQLSPEFSGDHIECRKCGREIVIKSA